ncbi:hypothetical protein AX16_007836 [Volvariella volvacea WC 439]|nr:hypothetical protein AX16_007836 [Volvariella volvacea WC 439]
MAHAPIGQFRSQFFPEEPTHCPTCYVYQDRYHVMFECRAARSIPALTSTDCKMRRIQRTQDRNLRFRKHIKLSPLKVGKSKIPSIMDSYFEWLKSNPIAFTFEGTPPTLPGTFTLSMFHHAWLGIVEWFDEETLLPAPWTAAVSPATAIIGMSATTVQLLFARRIWNLSARSRKVLMLSISIATLALFQGIVAFKVMVKISVKRQMIG